jgi:hypothetical protein
MFKTLVRTLKYVYQRILLFFHVQTHIFLHLQFSKNTAYYTLVCLTIVDILFGLSL